MSVAVLLTTPAVLNQIAGHYGRPDPNDNDPKWTTAEKVVLAVVVLVLAGMGWAGRHLGIY